MSVLSVLVLLLLLGLSWGQYIRDGGQPRLHIFHHSCALKKDEGPCKAVKDRFYFDIDSGRCESFEYGGCQGNANNFQTLDQCEEMCVVKENKSPCHLEDEPGPCRGLVPRYFFDSRKQECRRFFYGGCFGNANNFKTLKECRDRCHPGNDTDGPRPDTSTEKSPKPDELIDSAPNRQPQRQPRPEPSKEFTPPEPCLSPVDRGNCDRLERRYAFNPRVKRCQMFQYSGCGGNRNNFLHKRHCMKTCTPDHSRLRQIRIKTKNSNILFRSI
ncbi:tissue factor pathway inhibitor-like isoform X1 [Astyanax mexicanus]|uniref:Tissue factor pathway inhibitor n=1 Tax=Astyanax mexicanus TaxID=7994 RepID=A0A8T2LIF4_ASTMX|nr:tissue factor pathway inhibitor-like isoform X1 [Astyanax mexicanus]